MTAEEFSLQAGDIPMPEMSNNYQTAKFTLTPEYDVSVAYPANFFYYMSDPMSTPPATLDFSSGIKTFELEINFPRYDVGAVVNSLTLASLSFEEHIQIIIVNELTTYVVGVAKGNFSNIETLWSGTHSELPVRIGVELNATTSTFKIYLDGVEYAVNDNTYVPQNLIFATDSRVIYSPEGDDFNLISRTRLITRAAGMTTSFSSGATDPFGTPIP